jgi:hypothetical protein
MCLKSEQQIRVDQEKKTLDLVWNRISHVMKANHLDLLKQKLRFVVVTSRVVGLEEENYGGKQ